MTPTRLHPLTLLCLTLQVECSRWTSDLDEWKAMARKHFLQGLHSWCSWEAFFSILFDFLKCLGLSHRKIKKMEFLLTGASFKKQTRKVLQKTHICVRLHCSWYLSFHRHHDFFHTCALKGHAKANSTFPLNLKAVEIRTGSKQGGWGKRAYFKTHRCIFIYSHIRINNVNSTVSTQCLFIH